MEIQKIDLYEYFKIPREINFGGYLNCYLIDRTPEISINRKHPAILIIPGGGYTFVSKREGEPVALKYLANNFNSFILEYTVAPNGEYPTQLIEASMAMIYIREQSDKLGVNSNNVAAIGFSAGGHLCGCLATLFEEEVLMNLFGQKSNMIRPDAVVLSYPVITYIGKSHKGSFDNLCGNDEFLKKQLSLETRVSSKSSPAFIWHTNNDGSVPVENSLLMAAAYEKNAVSCELHIFQTGWHGLSIPDESTYKVNVEIPISINVKQWINMSINWLRERGFLVQD